MKAWNAMTECPYCGSQGERCENPYCNHDTVVTGSGVMGVEVAKFAVIKIRKPRQARLVRSIFKNSSTDKLMHQCMSEGREY